MELYYVRHGLTDWNVEGKIQGDTDIPLNDIGRSQAREAQKLLHDINFDFVIASPLSRAYETASIINETHHKEIIVDERLRERNFGDLEGNSIELSRVKTMWDPLVNYKPNNGESFLDVEKRINEFLDELKANVSSKTILIVAHGGISIPFQNYFNKIKTNKIINNCEVLHYHI